MTPSWEELGRELEAARGDAKAEQIARSIGISGKQLRNYERAIATSGRPAAERIVALADLYRRDPGPWLALAGYRSEPRDIEVARLVAQANNAARDTGRGVPLQSEQPFAFVAAVGGDDKADPVDQDERGPLLESERTEVITALRDIARQMVVLAEKLGGEQDQK